MGNICCASKAVQVSPNVRTGANLERSTPEQREVRRIGFNEL